VIYGQKTLQIARSALDRVNVRRLLIELARVVTAVGLRFVFEPNTAATRAQFVSQLTPRLATIQAQSGIDSYKIIMDASNNTQQVVEANRLVGTIVIVPTKAVEYIAIDFIITNAGVEFV
jgi:phage tail sheath protein FI